MALPSWLRNPFRRNYDVAESKAAAPEAPTAPERAGFVWGVPPGGVNENTTGMGAATQTDRRSAMQELYEAYLTCPWAWAAVNAIARTITAGGLVTDWDTDSGEGDQDTPEKPPQVLALERLLAFCNPNDDIRKLMRSVITDLLVFGDAFLEVVWAGGIPVSLYTLDCPTMTPLVDQHGTVSGYVQVTDFGQRATFGPTEVIHISLDAPRSGVFGVSPTQAARLPILSWLHAAATSKEIYRKGDPPNVHADMPTGMSAPELNRWVAQYNQRNIGPRNIGQPVITKGGAKITELAQSRVGNAITYLDQKRDEILAAYGVPPAKAGVIESGNLGGGTGEAQDITFKIDTCAPIAELILEKLNFHIVRQGFAIADWHLKFREVDYRDSKVIEDIRDARLRNGSWTLNKYRAEIGEPPVPGGDDAVLVDRQNLVMWADMDAASKATIASKLKGTALEPAEPTPGEPVTIEKPEPAPVPDMLKPFAGKNNEPANGEEDDGSNSDGQPPDAGETVLFRRQYASYRARLAEALRRMPDAGTGQRAA